MKKIIALFLTLTMSIGMSITVFAENGTGGGGGSQSPFILKNLTIEDGEIDVPVNYKIMLTFSKNVSDITVIEHNSDCIKLLDEYNNLVPIDVKKGTARQQLEIEFTNLNPNKSYKLMISGKIMARNGVDFLGKSYSYTFKTAGTNTNVACYSQTIDKVA